MSVIIDVICLRLYGNFATFLFLAIFKILPFSLFYIWCVFCYIIVQGFDGVSWVNGSASDM